MSPQDKLIASIFGVRTPEQQAELDRQVDEANARTLARDWAKAQEIRIRASEDFPQYQWLAALSFGWQAKAIAIREDGVVLSASLYGSDVGIITGMDEVTLNNTEVRQA